MKAQHHSPAGIDPSKPFTRFLSVAPASYSSESRTVDAIITTGAPVRRFGMIEEMSISPEAIDLSRASGGRMALLWNHDQNAPIGNVESVRFDGGLPVARLRFAETDEGRDFEGRVSRGELGQVSIGYRVTNWTLRGVENDIEVWRADQWELLEVSLVSVPADPAAIIRSADAPSGAEAVGESSNRAAAPTEKESGMSDVENRAAAESPVANDAAVSQPVQPVGNAADLVRTERARVSEIARIADEHNIDAARRASAIETGESLESFRSFVLDSIARKQASASHVRVETDETETRRAAMQEALVRQLAPSAAKADWSEPALAFRGMSLPSLAAARLGVRNLPDSAAARMDVLERAMHTTSDFPYLLENAMNKGIASSYELAIPTYREFSVREDFSDFRPHSTVTVGDFPLLKEVKEGGEIQFGTFGDKKELTAVLPYAIQATISRQAMVNDSLGGIANVLANYGRSLALLEEKIAYSILLANSGDGPTLLEGSAAMFTTGRTNKASAAAAITVASIALGRAAMAKYKSIDGNELAPGAPTILLVGPDKQTEAETIIAPLVPAQQTNVNPFSGRMRVVMSPFITGNAWWLFTDPASRSNFRWGLLNGYTAPRLRTEDKFGYQGMRVSVEHDFGFGGIDWRAGYRNAGA